MDGVDVGCGGWQFPNTHSPRRNFPPLLCAMQETTYSQCINVPIYLSVTVTLSLSTSSYVSLRPRKQDLKLHFLALTF